MRPAAACLPALALCSFLLSTEEASAQHCGTHGFHDPHSPDKRYKLSFVKERMKNWKWWEKSPFRWEEKGKAREFDVPVGGKDFEEGWVFVSPAGNGFLMTGKILVPAEPPSEPLTLFHFFDAEGRPFSRTALDEVFSEKEQIIRGSCGEKKETGESGCYRFYHLPEAPRLSADGLCVELRAAGTGRTVRFFLPLGLPVSDTLHAQILSILLPGKPDTRKQDIAKLVRDLDAQDAQVRTDAEDALLRKGWWAIGHLEKTLEDAPSLEFGKRASAILRRLAPWKSIGGPELLRDLDRMPALLSYPEEEVAREARRALTRVLPAEAAGSEDLPAWIREHRDRLDWNDRESRYDLRE